MFGYSYRALLSTVSTVVRNEREGKERKKMENITITVTLNNSNVRLHSINKIWVVLDIADWLLILQDNI